MDTPLPRKLLLAGATVVALSLAACAPKADKAVEAKPVAAASSDNATAIAKAAAATAADAAADANAADVVAPAPAMPTAPPTDAAPAKK